MKVLLYSDSRYYSGAERVLSKLADGLADSGLSVVLVVSPEIRLALEAEGIDSAVKIIYQANQTKLNFLKYFQYQKLLQCEKADVVAANMWSPFANTWLLLAAYKRRTPIITIFHYYQEKKQIRGWMKPLKLWAYGLAQRLSSTIVSPSRALATILENDYHFPSSKLKIIPNGSNDPGLSARLKLDRPVRFLVVGSLEKDKGQRFLLSVLAELKGEWKLDFAGDGPERGLIEQDIQRFYLSDKVRCLGRIEDISVLFPKYDILIHPSMFENLSLSMIEAISYGLPVVAHQVGGNPEIIENNKEGWLIRLTDQESWQSTLRKVVALTPEEYARYSRGALEKYRLFFTMQSMIGQYRQLIEKYGKD